jgi:DNA-binding CsgD family transcriptional regulator
MRRHTVGATLIRAGWAPLEGSAIVTVDDVLDSTGVQQVNGVDAVRDRIDELSFFATSCIRSVVPGGQASAASAAAARPLDARAARRGLRVRVIHDVSRLDGGSGLWALHGLMTTGAAVRLLPGPLDRILIFDDAAALVPLDTDGPLSGALLVRRPALLRPLVRSFDLAWTVATEPPGHPEPRMAAEDRAVLEILARGATDEVVARTLGMSPRTVRRRVARLLQELGVGSRFAAGATAARRGWI